MNHDGKKDSDDSNFEEACSFARQFDVTSASDDLSSVTTNDSIIKFSENYESEQEDDNEENEISSDEDDGTYDDENDDEDYENFDEDSDGSLSQQQSAVTEIDLNNLPERINEKIFQLLINQSKNSTAEILSKKFEYLNNDYEDEIKAETDLLEATLICPLSKKRIEIPARGENCNHLNCFDLKAFLVMNDKRSQWLCPLCDKSANYESLFIDTLFSEILNKSKEDKIQFLTSEDWIECSANKQSLNSSDSLECIVIE